MRVVVALWSVAMMAGSALPAAASAAAHGQNDSRSTVIIWDGSRDVPTTPLDGHTDTLDALSLTDASALMIRLTDSRTGPQGHFTRIQLVVQPISLLRTNCAPGSPMIPSYCGQLRRLDQVIAAQTLLNLNTSGDVDLSNVGALPAFGLPLVSAALPAGSVDGTATDCDTTGFEPDCSVQYFRLGPREQATLNAIRGVVGAANLRVGIEVVVVNDGLVRDVYARTLNIPDPSHLQPILTYPADGHVIAGTARPFSWTGGGAGASYRLRVGTALHGADLFDSGATNATAATIPASLPLERTLFADLATTVSGTTQVTSSTFVLRQPSTLSFDPSRSAFSWTAIAGAEFYRLLVGRSPGANDLLDTGDVTTPSLRGFSLPSGTLFTRLITDIDEDYGWRDGSVFIAPAQWQSADAGNRGLGVNFGGSPAGDAFLYNPTTGAWAIEESDPFTFSDAGEALWAPGWTVQTGDFNADGLTDLLLYNPTNGAWFKVTNLGNGQFAYFGSRWAPGWQPNVLDFNGDGRSDVFLYNPTTGSWFRCESVGDGDFVYTTGRWAPGWQIFVGDFNGDGRSDLFLYNGNSGSDANHGLAFRVLSLADGSFQYVAEPFRWAAGWSIVPGDFDGDGQTDLFLYQNQTSSPIAGMWRRVFFRTTGTDIEGDNASVWATGWQTFAGDFNGDGRADMFLYNPVNGMWFVVISESSGQVTYYSGRWAPNWSISVTDFNGDGIADLLLYNPLSGNAFRATTLAPGVFGFLGANLGQGWSVTATRRIVP